MDREEELERQAKEASAILAEARGVTLMEYEENAHADGMLSLERHRDSQSRPQSQSQSQSQAQSQPKEVVILPPSFKF